MNNMRLAFSLISSISIVFYAYSLLFAFDYYVATNGNDNNTGTSWADAWSTISNAVAKVSSGDTIFVSNGLYNITKEILISNKIVIIKGVTGDPRDVRVNAQGLDLGMYRACFYLVNATGTVIESMIISNCQNYGIYINYGGTVKNCILSGHKGSYAAGIYCRAGVIENCIISNNFSVYSAAVNILNGSVIRNSLIIDNINVADYLAYTAGGIYTVDSMVENCTITRNTGYYCGGISGLAPLSRVRNSIIWGNISKIYPYYNFGVNCRYFVDTAGLISFSNSCIGILPASGSNNVISDPQFVDWANGDFRLLPSSPCINAGSNANWMAGTNDLDGNPRIVGGRVDIGCYEYQIGALDCGFIASSNSAFEGSTVRFVGGVMGTNTIDVYYSWDFTNGNNFGAGVLGMSVVSNTYLSSGVYSVGLRVSNLVGEVKTFVRSNYVRIGPRVLYVARGGNEPLYPYSGWGSAASNLHEAIDAAVEGSEVIVSNGVYYLTNQIVIDKGITVRALNGATNTVLDGSNNVSCAYLSHTNAILQGFTIQRGAAGTNTIRHYGGGMSIFYGGTVRECIVQSNKSDYANTVAGIYFTSPYAFIDRCVIRWNRGNDAFSIPAVGRGWGTLRNSLIIHNSGKGLGAISAYKFIMESCTIAGNTITSSPTYAAGIRWETAGALYLFNNIIWSNYTVGTLSNYNVIPTIAWLYASNNCTYPSTNTPNSGNWITNDPRFADNNYHLFEDSPCVNAGINQTWMSNDYDVEGNPRIFRGIVDIGAYEKVIRGTIVRIY